MAKWRLVQQQRQELQAEWEVACRQHNSAVGLPDSSRCMAGGCQRSGARRSLQRSGACRALS